MNRFRRDSARKLTQKVDMDKVLEQEAPLPNNMPAAPGSPLVATSPEPPSAPVKPAAAVVPMAVAAAPVVRRQQEVVAQQPQYGPDHILGRTPEATISKGVSVGGEISFNSLLRIDGKFDGALKCDGGCLIVGATAEVKSNISGMKEVYIEGTFNGDIDAELVQLRGNAVVRSNITCMSLGMDPGAHFKGSTNITPRAKWSKRPFPDAAPAAAAAAVAPPAVEAPQPAAAPAPASVRPVAAAAAEAPEAADAAVERAAAAPPKAPEAAAKRLSSSGRHARTSSTARAVAASGSASAKPNAGA